MILERSSCLKLQSRCKNNLLTLVTRQLINDLKNYFFFVSCWLYTFFSLTGPVLNVVFSLRLKNGLEDLNFCKSQRDILQRKWYSCVLRYVWTKYFMVRIPGWNSNFEIWNFRNKKSKFYRIFIKSRNFRLAFDQKIEILVWSPYFK